MNNQIDEHLVNDVPISLTSYSWFYFGIVQPVLKNLVGKMHKGIYNSDKAIILWEHAIDNAVRRSEFKRDYCGDIKINRIEKREIAKYLQEHYEDELQEKVERLKVG